MEIEEQYKPIITLEISLENYRKYKLCNQNDSINACAGYIMLEYDNYMWDIAVMEVLPAYGDIHDYFIEYILFDMDLSANNIRVCPISIKDALFYKRHGFNLPNCWENRL